MTTTTLTAKEFYTRFHACMSRKEVMDFNKMPDSTRHRLFGVLESIDRYAKREMIDDVERYDLPFLPFLYRNTAYAMEQSVLSGRVNGQTEIAMCALKTRDIVTLVYEVHQNCSYASDIPAYLMRKYTTL